MKPPQVNVRDLFSFLRFVYEILRLIYINILLSYPFLSYSFVNNVSTECVLLNTLNSLKRLRGITKIIQPDPF